MNNPAVFLYFKLEFSQETSSLLKIAQVRNLANRCR